ncbi:nucleolar-like protein [Tasmannia lanceolata]|uniref:nucleolar-like protein n=1 Tax=Tasmannia lanceolata TaxID=3420 RepID=UPI0040648B35
MAKKKSVSKSPSGGKKKKKQGTKKLLSGPNTMAMKSKPAKENPFETIWSRRKFDILGKKRKGEERRVGSARSLAIEKRKKTLLKEYEQSGKSSVFLDKRIGEQNDALEEFDKAILRFQRERQLKLNRKNKYNLSDGEEEDDFASLSKMDDFDDELSPNDDVDATETERNSASFKPLKALSVSDQLEPGSLEGEETKHKTKKEVMEEIISKSKFYKAQKAKDKEEDDHLMEQLDKDFTSLAQSEVFLSVTQPSKMNALKALLNKSNTKDKPRIEGLSGAASIESSRQERPDAYDCLVKEMVLEMRARPSDRTKTPEEIAQEERERLEQLEEERRKRMLATDDFSDEGNDGPEDYNKLSPKKLKSVSGDDLGDSFSVDEQLPNKKGWVDEILEGNNVDHLENDNSTSSEDSESGDDDSDPEEESDEDDGVSGDELSAKDWEQSDEDNLGTGLENENGMEEKVLGKVNDNNAKKQKSQKTDSPDRQNASGERSSIQPETLPFVIEAPNSLVELRSLLDNRSDSEVAEAINRIRACNAIRLAAENRKKMQVFYGVLLQYFAVLANKKPLNFRLMNLLVKPLMEMTIDTPYFAAICARERLVRIRTQFCEDIKNPEKSSWPSLKTLMLLRLWSMIFPCSDFRHVVMTPAILLMCEYLMRCPIVSCHDIAIGSFLCSMVLSVSKQSQKFCPEAIIFLQTLLIAASETEQGLDHPSHIQWYYFTEIKVLKPWLRISTHVSDIHPLDFLMVMGMPVESPFFSSDSFRASVLVSVIETLRGFVNIYEGLSSFPEIFLPISVLLHKVLKQENMPDLLRGNMKDVAELIKKKADEHQKLRQPLEMRKQKPVPIKLLNPKFEENFVKGRDYDPNRERAERKKLKKLLKQEAKGAARELRKDNYFLHEVKEKERLLLEEERAENYGKARAFLQEQEHAFKSGQLGKGRKRRK